jgi:hypothetical protein
MKTLKVGGRAMMARIDQGRQLDQLGLTEEYWVMI